MWSDWVLLFVILLQLCLCPLTKVEESFNLQATHDLLEYNGHLEEFDHFQFPGVVPRTFVGPLVLAAVTKPITWLTEDKFVWLMSVRTTLGLLVWMAFRSLNKSVAIRFGFDTAKWVPLVMATQFHFGFYASRTLPNVFAIIPTLLAMAQLLRHQYSKAIWCATAAVVIFRSELLLLFGPLFIPPLISGRLPIRTALKQGILAAMTSLLVTVAVDSYFWQKWIWPEGQVWYYNVVLGQSVNWGTSPLHWYFSSALPRALGLSILLVIIGSLSGTKIVTTALAPSLVFVCLYSLLAHKELRFIIYVIPLLSVVAAKGTSVLWNLRRGKSQLGKLTIAAVLGGNLVLSSVFLHISVLNYPGGEALLDVHQKLATEGNLSVHIDVYPAETGVSRFLQLRNDWAYDKTEGLVEGGDQLRQFDVLVVGTPDGNADATAFLYEDSHQLIHRQQGFDRLDWSWLKGKQFRPIVLSDKVIVLKKKRHSHQ